MSVTKPSAYPKWASSGTIAVPSGAKQSLGWVVEKPPYQFFNWLLNLLYQWTQWFDQGYKNIQRVTASGTTNLVLGSVWVTADATLGNQVLQLPDISADDGMEVSLTLTGTASSHTATLTAFGTQKFVDGTGTPGSTEVVDQVGTTITAVSYGGNWYLK